MVVGGVCSECVLTSRSLTKSLDRVWVTSVTCLSSVSDGCITCVLEMTAKTGPWTSLVLRSLSLHELLYHFHVFLQSLSAGNKVVGVHRVVRSYCNRTIN